MRYGSGWLGRSRRANRHPLGRNRDTRRRYSGRGISTITVIVFVILIVIPHLSGTGQEVVILHPPEVAAALGVLYLPAACRVARWHSRSALVPLSPRKFQTQLHYVVASPSETARAASRVRPSHSSDARVVLIVSPVKWASELARTFALSLSVSRSHRSRSSAALPTGRNPMKASCAAQNSASLASGRGRRVEDDEDKDQAPVSTSACDAAALVPGLVTASVRSTICSKASRLFSSAFADIGFGYFFSSLFCLSFYFSFSFSRSQCLLISVFIVSSPPP